MVVAGAHGSDIGGQGDKAPGAGRASARRPHVDDGRYFGGVKGFDNFSGGFEQASGGVQLNHQTFAAARLGHPDRPGDIARRGWADGAFDPDMTHLGAGTQRGCRRVPQQRHH